MIGSLARDSGAGTFGGAHKVLVALLLLTCSLHSCRDLSEEERGSAVLGKASLLLRGQVPVGHAVYRVLDSVRFTPGIPLGDEVDDESLWAHSGDTATDCGRAPREVVHTWCKGKFARPKLWMLPMECAVQMLDDGSVICHAVALGMRINRTRFIWSFPSATTVQEWRRKTIRHADGATPFDMVEKRKSYSSTEGKLSADHILRWI